jgi:hypothetical protein
MELFIVTFAWRRAIERRVNRVHIQMTTTNAKVPVGITASSVLTRLFFTELGVVWTAVNKNIVSDSLSTIFQIHSTHIQ